MLLLAAIAFHFLGLLSSIHAVMSTRTPQGAIAWAASLNTFPYIAVPAYWVLKVSLSIFRARHNLIWALGMRDR